MTRGGGLMGLVIVCLGVFLLLALFAPTPRPVGVNRVTSQPVKGVTVRPTIEAARTAPQVPPQRSCRLGSWRWANHADTRRAFAEGTIDSEGVERIRIMAWDRTAFIARRADGWHVVVDGEEDAARPRIVSKAPLFSPDSRHWAYVAGTDDGRQVVVWDGRPQGSYRSVEETKLAFSPDSAHLVWTAWSTGWRLVVDGVESAERFAGFPPDAPVLFDTATRVRTLAQAAQDLSVVRYRTDLPAEPGVRTAAER